MKLRQAAKIGGLLSAYDIIAPDEAEAMGVANNLKNNMIKLMAKKPGTANIPPKITPKAVGDVQISHNAIYRDGKINFTYDTPANIRSKAREFVYEKTHEGQEIFYRRTHNPNEHLINDIQSRNHADNRAEGGLSVSEHPYYPGYKYTGVVKGDIVGYGSDGEPILKNVQWLHKPVPADKLPAKYQYENIAKKSPIDYADIDNAELIHVEDLNDLPNPSRPPEVGGQSVLNSLKKNPSTLKTIVPMLGTAAVLYPHISQAGEGQSLPGTITKMGVAAPVGAVLAEELAKKREMERKWEGGGLQEAYNPIDMAVAAATGGGPMTYRAAQALFDLLTGMVTE